MGSLGSPGPKAGHRAEESHDAEQDAHCCFHAAGGTNVEEEACLTLAGVAQDVEFAPGHVNTVADPERSLATSDANGKRAGKHIDALVLAGVGMARDPAARIEPDLQLQQLAGGVLRGL